MKIGAAYIIVSTHMQEELSPDAQKRLLIEYAKNNGILLDKKHIYIDKGISGKKAEKRPEFMRMITAAKQKPSPFNVILVWKFSRFARNQEESIVFKSMLRNKCSVDVVSITESITDDVYGGLIERIIEWMDEFYSIRLGEDVTRGMTENALRGNFQASPALGYTVVAKGEMPVIVPEEAKIVKFIFFKFLNTPMSFYDIARELNMIGYKTKRGNEFEARSIKYILQNPIYKGYLRWNYSDSAGKKIKDQDEWIIVKAKGLEAIISESEWNMANDRIEKEYLPAKRRPTSTKRHWLSGFVKCSNCGRTLSTSVHTDKRYGRTYTNFQCYGYLKGKCLKSHSISEKRLVPGIIQLLLQDSSKEFVDCDFVQNNTTQEKISALKNLLNKLPEKERRIKEAYRNGIDTLEEYKENKELIVKEKHSLETQISELSKPVKNIEKKMPKRIKSVYDVITSDTSTKEEKAAAIASIIKKIVYNKELDTLDIYYYYS